MWTACGISTESVEKFDYVSAPYKEVKWVNKNSAWMPAVWTNAIKIKYYGYNIVCIPVNLPVKQGIFLKMCWIDNIFLHIKNYKILNCMKTYCIKNN